MNLLVSGEKLELYNEHCAIIFRTKNNSKVLFQNFSSNLC